MYQQFFKNTIASKFIKNLLAHTPIPNIPTANDYDYIIEGFDYIYKASIIRCNSSGWLNSDTEGNYLRVSDSTIADDGLLVGYILPPAKYDVIADYDFGTEYKQFTERYLSKYDYYDTETHIMLGKYLRCIRDIYNIDLMPFYNCFCYKVANDFIITDKGIDKPTDNSLKVFLVPIKFNRTYTIAIDSATPVRMKPVFYDKVGLLRADYDEESETLLSDKIEGFDRNYASMRFKYPIKYRVGNDDKDLQRNEDSLYLAIQMSAKNDSSIVVLEGDYTEVGVSKVYSDGILDTLISSEINSLFLTDLSLLMFNDRNIYAFSDRLIEYLLLNVIDNTDPLYGNIAKTQANLAVNVPRYIRKMQEQGVYDASYAYGVDFGTYGAWNTTVRSWVYRLYNYLRKQPAYDMNGFVDKDTEKTMMRGVPNG